MFRLGLIGKTLSHSFSKMYFEEKFRRESIPGYTYELFELPDIQQITDFIRRHPDLIGFNVTIPYKQQIIPFLDELSEEAAEIGAVNTVLIKHIGNQIFTKGFNTDAEGFRQSLNGYEPPARALVLGTGGAAAAVTYVLERQGCACTAVSNINEKPDIPYEGISGEHFLYDLVYNPAETAFLKEGIRRGAEVRNGLAMLHAQAEAAWEIWQNL